MVQTVTIGANQSRPASAAVRGEVRARHRSAAVTSGAAPSKNTRLFMLAAISRAKHTPKLSQAASRRERSARIPSERAKT